MQILLALYPPQQYCTPPGSVPMVGRARVRVPQRGGRWAEQEEGDEATRHQAQGEAASQGEEAGELHADT